MLRDSENEEGDTVPVTVTAVCDVAINTDIPAKKRTIATQTISVIISEITEMETLDSSFNESLVEARACRETVRTPINQATSDRALLSWYEEEMFKIDKKCDRAEKRLDKVECEQRKELSVLRAEQSLIREDMERLRNRVQKESTSTFRTSTQVNAQRVDRPSNQTASNGLNLDSTWDASKEQRQILTQDSQGDPIMTKIMPAHHIEYTPAPTNAEGGKGKGKQHHPGGRPRPLAVNDSNESECLLTKEIARPNKKPNATIPQPTSNATGNEGNAKTRPEVSTYSDAVISPPKPQRDQRTRKQTKDFKRTTDSDTDAKRRRLDNSKSPKRGSSQQFAKASTSGTQSTQGKCTSDSNDSDSSDAKSHYDPNISVRTILTKYGWLKVQGGKPVDVSKPVKVDKKKAGRRLKGATESINKEFCLKGVSCVGFKSTREVEDAVKHFCEAMKVFTVYQRVLSFRPNQTSVNCKLVVQEADIDKVLSKGFWPKGVGIRDWYEKPNERNRYFNEKEAISDSST